MIQRHCLALMLIVLVVNAETLLKIGWVPQP